MIETCSAHLGDMRSKLEVVVEDDTKIPSRVGRGSFNVKKSDGEKGLIFLTLLSVANEQELRFVRVKLELVSKHPIRDRTHTQLKHSERVRRVTRGKGNIQLAVISIQVVIDGVFVDNSAERSGVHCEKERTKDGALWHTKRYVHTG